MANDFNAAWLAGVAAMDSLVNEFGPVGTKTLTQQLAEAATAAGDLAVANGAKVAAETLAAQRRSVIDGMLADLTNEDAADATGDAARAAAKIKAQGAP